MRKVRKITASVSFDEERAGDEEAALQTLGESVLDDCAEVSFEYFDDAEDGS